MHKKPKREDWASIRSGLLQNILNENQKHKQALRSVNYNKSCFAYDFADDFKGIKAEILKR
jgi:hypothetical protein